MIAMIWRFFVAMLDWRTAWRRAGVCPAMNLVYGADILCNNLAGSLVLEGPSGTEKKETESNIEVIQINADGFERTHRVFWFIFEWTIGQLLAWWVERKSIKLIGKNLTEQEKESWKTIEGRRQILAECRRNFGKKRVAELFELRTRLFNRSSLLLQHFCKNVANAPALDDVYNALGSFSFNEQTVWPEAAKPDIPSRIYLSCPNGQAVRNRYRAVVNFYKKFGGEDILSIATGSAQPLIHAKGGSGSSKLLLTDIDPLSLDLAKRRATQAGIPESNISFLKVSFKCLPKRLAGKKYDVVEGCGIFEYLSDEQTLFLLGLMLKFLKPGGKIIVSGMEETRGASLLRKIYNWEIIYRSPNKLASLVVEAGGRDVRVYIEPWGIHYVIVASI